MPLANRCLFVALVAVVLNFRCFFFMLLRLTYFSKVEQQLPTYSCQLIVQRNVIQCVIYSTDRWFLKKKSGCFEVTRTHIEFIWK